MNFRRTLRVLTALTPVAAISVAAPAAAAPKQARVHLQIPVDVAHPTATDLDSIESYGKQALWSKSFEIPYDALETKIGKELEDVLAKKIPSGPQVETCTDPCPDVTWEIDYTPSFAFTKKGALSLKKIGPSGDNHIRAAVTFRAKVGLTGNIHAEADVPTAMPVGFIMTHKKVDVPFDLFVEAEFDASVDVTLWPDIEATNVKIDGKVIDVSDQIELNGELAEAGAEIGLLLGNTPMGLAAGGPLAFSTLLAVIGDSAADSAEAAIHSALDGAIHDQFNKGIDQVQKMVSSKLATATATANAKKNAALNTKLPGIGKSLHDLTTELGADLALHTVTPTNTIAASAVLRLSPKSGSASVAGKVRIPARKCVYAELMGVRMPIGYQAINAELDAKVGTSCSTALSGVRLDPYSYLGADPRTALGSTADHLATWKSGIGDATLAGTLSKTDAYYQCGFSATGLPNTAIEALRLRKGSSGLDVLENEERLLVSKIGGKTLVLDHKLKPTASPVAGGTYECGGSGGGPVGTPSQLEQLEDLLDHCPQCGRISDRRDAQVLQLKNVSALTGTAIGKQVAAMIAKHGTRVGTRKAARARAMGRARGRAMTKVSRTQVSPMAKPASKAVAKPTSSAMGKPTMRKMAPVGKAR